MTTRDEEMMKDDFTYEDDRHAVWSHLSFEDKMTLAKIFGLDMMNRIEERHLAYTA